jgi:AraC-like DNA-binding protein
LHIFFCMAARRLQHHAQRYACRSSCLAGSADAVAAVADRWSAGSWQPSGHTGALRILLTRAGRVRFDCEPVLELGPGSVAVVPAQWHYRGRMSREPWDMCALLVWGPWADRISERITGPWLLWQDPPATVAAGIERMVDALLSGSPDWDWRCAAGLAELVTVLPQASDSWRERCARLFDAAPDQPWRVGDLAEALAVSVSALAHGFRDETGTTPAAFIRQRRIALAARMLATQSASAVAQALGFSDPFHFSRAFKREMGAPPSRYRREMLNVGV